MVFQKNLGRDGVNVCQKVFGGSWKTRVKENRGDIRSLFKAFFPVATKSAMHAEFSDKKNVCVSLYLSLFWLS